MKLSFQLQHESFLFSPPSSVGSLCTSTRPPCATFGCYSLDLTLQISCTSSSNTSLTLTSVKADVSMKSRLLSLANSIARSVDTRLSIGFFSQRSSLLPTSIITMSGSACSFTSSIHFFTLANDQSFVRSQTMRAPRLFLQCALVIALKRSCPAVSQICALTVPPVFSGTGLVANSTPIVGNLLRGREPLMQRESRCVLPTPVSPTRMILKRKLQSSSCLVFILFFNNTHL
ncbi:hypothetical protein FGO68_gene9358 [Halteria grandinella]|uniref:Uncharacterized protein n=1 Tax=Halteria grandinella TaxID=5974 RepID=A0A8J8T7D1_HALGN|nr:hypothetical protein FGO68_gene9358 [Halteria grandinella]